MACIALRTAGPPALCPTWLRGGEQAAAPAIHHAAPHCWAGPIAHCSLRSAPQRYKLLCRRQPTSVVEQRGGGAKWNGV